MTEETHDPREPRPAQADDAKVPGGGYEPLHPERLTWAVLLGRWVEFARSAVALPTEGEAGRMRNAVPQIIGLQAVWFALGQIDELAGDEQALGLDRARVLIDRHTGAVHGLWAGREPPSELQELIADAERAWKDASGAAGTAG